VEIRRRTFVQWGIATLVFGGFGASRDGGGVLDVAMTTHTAATDLAPAEEPELPIRYQFNCIAADGTGIGNYSSLDEVWSTSQYMRIANCDVLYIGAGPYALTADEAAAVDVARAAGSQEQSATVLFLQIIGACTRIDSKTLDARLALLGAPVVKGALNFAPLAPQAMPFERWLAAHP
jgi:hypothetical protein